MMNAVQGQPGMVAGKGFDVRASLWEATKEKADMLRSMVVQEDSVEINESFHYEYLQVSSLQTFDREAKSSLRGLVQELSGRVDTLTDRVDTLTAKVDELLEEGPVRPAQAMFANPQGRSAEHAAFKIEYSFEATYSRNYTTNFRNAVGAAGVSQEKLDKLKDYFSPENTSQRIVDFATSFFPLYLENHAGEEGTMQEKLDAFMDLVKGAIDKGFERAREILGNMPQPVQDITDETYDLVQLKLDSWKNEQEALFAAENFVDSAEESPDLEAMVPVPDMPEVVPAAASNGVNERALEGTLQPPGQEKKW